MAIQSIGHIGAIKILLITSDPVAYLGNDHTEKKKGAKIAVCLSVTHLPLWSYFGATSKGGAVSFPWYSCFYF